MAEPAESRAKRTKVEAVPPPTEDAAGEGSETDAPGACPVAWCPICMAVTAVQPLKPEVIEHLLKAGTELLLAFRGVIDARADELSGQDDAGSGGPARLEKIELG
jgi:hypothetical protein